jgi:catechol-2,3-dioxygenase
MHAKDPAALAEFYREVLGMKAVGGSGPDNPFVGASNFLSSRPDEESHEIVFFADARLRHTAFRVATLAELRERYRSVAARGLPIKMALNHGVSLAFYFDDPEGNMIEIYWATDLHYGQPYGHPIDLTLPEDALLRDVEELAARQGIEWRADR